MRRFRLEKFRGAVTSVDAESIPENAAQDTAECRLEDGCIRPRYGYKKLADPLGTNCYGFAHLVGGDASTYAELEEYLSIEKVGATVKPYPINPATGVKGSAITNAGAALSLNASNWHGFAWNDRSYWYNPTDGIAKHTIGTATSWTPIVTPAAPTVRPTFSIEATGGFDIAGIDPSNAAEVACTGLASNTSSSYASGTMRIRHTTGIGNASIEMILSGTTAGNRDFYWRDSFSFSVYPLDKTHVTLDPSSIRVTLSNTDGTAVTITGTVYTTKVNAAGGFGVLVWWDRGKVRSDWGNGSGTAKTAKIKIDYSLAKNTSSGVSSSSSAVAFNFGDWAYIGWTRTLPLDTSGLSNQTLSVAYSYYNSTTDMESGLSPVLEIPYADLRMPDPSDVHIEDVGPRVSLAFTASGSVDKVRIYVKDLTGAWRRITTIDDTTSPYVYYTPYSGLIDLTAYDSGLFETTRKVVGGFPFKSWVVWLYQGTGENIRHSRIGNAESQWSPYDAEDDYRRGANFTLGNNYDDEPLNGHQCGDAVVISGSRGMYTQVGDYPAGMTPCTKVPGSFGCANKYASARWNDDNGNAIVVYLSKTDGNLYYVYVDPSGIAQNKELAPGIRNKIASYLTTNLGNIMLAVDPNNDSLWVIYGKKVMVLRRPNLADKTRPWEFYSYTLGSNIARVAFTTKRRNKWMRVDGTLDDVEYDSQASVWLTTDDGTAYSPTWTSKVFYGPNRRLDLVKVDRETLTDPVTITAYCDRQITGNSRTIAASTTSARFGALQSGKRHWYKIALGGSSGIRGLEIEEKVAGDRRVS